MKKKSAGAANGFLASRKAHWQGMKIFSKNDLCRLDWILTMLILAGLFVTCVHSDVKLTGNRSFLMYEHLTDFYQASYEQSGGYYANYLPSTFLAYMIWNLPLYLTGHIPEAILTNSFINIMWYKLLPVILYFVTAQLIYRIGMLLGFEEKKSLLAKFAFLVFPMAVYSQFIFGQYDIFTVFFVVWALYMYLKGSRWRFSLLMGIAVTFKYQAILYFLVLLLLTEKKIRNLIKYAAAMAVVPAIEILPNLGSEAFRKNVFGFGALDYVQKSFSLGFFNGMNLMAAALGFVLVWAYQKKVSREEEAPWAIFFCVAVNFALFGFSTWNPQWILMMVPFLVLNIMMNENGNLLLMVTNVFMLALYIFGSQSMVDERVLNSGILKYFIQTDSMAVRMWDLYRYHDQNMLCSAMWVVLLIYTVFGHPRYLNRRGSTISRGLIQQVRAAFVFGVAAFVLPLGICAADAFQGNFAYFDNSMYSLESEHYVMLSNGAVTQEFQADSSTLENIKICVYRSSASEDSASEASVRVRIVDVRTGESIYESEKNVQAMSDNAAYYSFVDGPVAVEEGQTYALIIDGTGETLNDIGFYYRDTTAKKYLMSTAGDDENTANRRLQMRIIGSK